jgi:hypothetical protein
VIIPGAVISAERSGRVPAVDVGARRTPGHGGGRRGGDIDRKPIWKSRVFGWR